MERSGAGSGSDVFGPPGPRCGPVSQKYGSADPDPYQNVTVPVCSGGQLAAGLQDEAVGELPHHLVVHARLVGIHGHVVHLLLFQF